LSDIFLLTANSISSCLFVGWNDSHPNGPRIKNLTFAASFDAQATHGIDISADFPYIIITQAECVIVCGAIFLKVTRNNVKVLPGFLLYKNYLLSLQVQKRFLWRQTLR
jgi:hypothetical protein